MNGVKILVIRTKIVPIILSRRINRENSLGSNTYTAIRINAYFDDRIVFPRDRNSKNRLT